MGTFAEVPKTLVQKDLIGGRKTASIVPPEPAVGGGPGGVVSSFTAQPGGATTLQALMLRQKEAAARQQQNLQQPQGTILGGLGQMATSIFTGLEQRRAENEEAAGRDEIVRAITSIDPETGIASPEILAAVMRRDPEMGLQLYQQAMEQRRAAAKEDNWVQIDTPPNETGQWFRDTNTGETKKVGGGTEPTGPKITDESGLRQDFIGSGAYKRITESEPVYQSMLEAADDTSAASDLNLVYGIAKLYDPTSVVREGEVVMQQGTQGMPDQIAGLIARWNKGERVLGPDARKALMEQAHSRISAYYDQAEADAQWYRDTATRYGMNPDNIVKPFKRPRKWGEEEPPVEPEAAAEDDDKYPG